MFFLLTKDVSMCIMMFEETWVCDYRFPCLSVDEAQMIPIRVDHIYFIRAIVQLRVSQDGVLLAICRDVNTIKPDAKGPEGH